MNIFSIMQMFQRNPLALIQQKFKIPQGMNTPDQILNHLLESGQVTQEQIDHAMSMKNSFNQFMR